VKTVKEHRSTAVIGETPRVSGPSVSEAGRSGGLRTLEKHGRSFFSAIGRKGQKRLRERWPGMARTWGAMGGRPTKGLLGCGEASTNQRKEEAGPP